MLKRYFKTFDNVGWALFLTGCTTLILTCFLIYVAYSFGYPLVACILMYLGTSWSLKVLNIATLGSIYRNRDGKNKDIYMENKEHLDKRFNEIYEHSTPDKKNTEKGSDDLR